MPRMPPLPRDALPLPRDAVPLTVSASKVVGSVSPLVDLSRGGYSWPQATSANCQESWCREVLLWGVGGEGVWVWVGVLIPSLSLSECASASISEHWRLCRTRARRDGATRTTQHTTSAGIRLQTQPTGTRIRPCLGLSQHILPMSKQSRRAWCLFRCVLLRSEGGNTGPAWWRERRARCPRLILN